MFSVVVDQAEQVDPLWVSRQKILLPKSEMRLDVQYWVSRPTHAESRKEKSEHEVRLPTPQDQPCRVLLADFEQSERESKQVPNISNEQFLEQFERALTEKETLILRVMARQYGPRTDEQVRKRLLSLAELDDPMATYWLIRSIAEEERNDNFPTLRRIMLKNAGPQGPGSSIAPFVRLAIYDSVWRANPEDALGFLLDLDLFKAIEAANPIFIHHYPPAQMLACILADRLPAMIPALEKREQALPSDQVLVSVIAQFHTEEMRSALLRIAHSHVSDGVRKKALQIVKEETSYIPKGVGEEQFMDEWTDAEFERWLNSNFDKVKWNEKTRGYECFE